jgi:hypothetical protein
MGDEKKVDHGALVVGGLYASSLYMVEVMCLAKHKSDHLSISCAFL